MSQGHTAQPSETSPLLPKPVGSPSDATTPPIEPSSAIAPGGPQLHDGPDEHDGGDIERQVSHGDTPKHQGMPEVKKRMKYIFPAIAIGVFLAAADQTLVVSTYGTIGTELHALNNTSWIATAYALPPSNVPVHQG
jgi:hypothetical protein